MVVLLFVQDEEGGNAQTYHASDRECKCEGADGEGSLIVAEPETGQLANAVKEEGLAAGDECSWENGEPELVWKEDEGHVTSPLTDHC